MATVLTVGTLDCNDGDSITLLAPVVLGKPNRRAEEFSGPAFDVARMGAIDESSGVETSFRLLIQGTSVDDVDALVTTLRIQLRSLAPIVFALDGSSYVGVMQPLLTQCVEVPLDKESASALIHMYWTIVEVNLLREPWIRLTSETIVSAASTTTPAVVSLSGQNGEAPAPLEIRADADTLLLSSVWAGVYPEETATVDDFVSEIAALTWSDGEGVVDETGYQAPVELVLDGTPSGSTWPTTWDRSDAGTHVHAASSKFHIEDDATPHDSWMESTDPIFVVASRSYMVAAQVEIVSNDSSNGTFGVYVDWYTSGDVLISTSTLIGMKVSIYADTLWQVTVVAPATAARAKVRAAWDNCTGASAAIVYAYSLKESNAWKAPATDSGMADIDVSSLLEGEYMVLAKCLSEDYSDPGSIRHEFGSRVDILSETLQWMPLGTAVLGGDISALGITLFGGAAAYATINAVAFLPCGFGGMVGWRRPLSAGAVSGHAHEILWQDEKVYADSVNDMANSFAATSLRALGGLLVIIAEQTTPAATTAVELSISDEPRFEQLPSSGAVAGPGI